MKRKVSRSKLAKGLYRLAAEAEHKASKLREVGLHDHARAAEDAARALSNAADKVAGATYS